MTIIETERLLLREFETADIDSLAYIFADAEVMKFSRGIKSREETRAWLAKCSNNYSSFGFGLWAVVEKSGQEVIGYCGLSCFPDICGQKEVEVGYRLARSRWGFGFATEAALAVREYGFNVVGLERLIALVDPDNTASIRVARKIGMEFEKEAFLEGYDYPDHVYSIEKQPGDKERNRVIASRGE
ncbi:MAG: GNAT family N-acetyltransferase [Verrucomicrobiota bacterium]